MNESMFANTLNSNHTSAENRRRKLRHTPGQPAKFVSPSTIRAEAGIASVLISSSGIEPGKIRVERNRVRFGARAIGFEKRKIKCRQR